jgi:hypothetical protein
MVVPKEPHPFDLQESLQPPTGQGVPLRYDQIPIDSLILLDGCRPHP